MALLLDTVDLDDWCWWVDRYQWSPVGQNARYALDGTLYLTENARRGRPITLATTPQGAIDGTAAEALRGLAATVGAVYSLTVDDDTYTVRFRRGDGPPVELELIHPMREDGAENWYRATIRLIETP